MTLFVLGRTTNLAFFYVLCGCLCGVMSIDVFMNGFPGITDTFLVTGLGSVLAGLCFYLLVAPSVEELEAGAE